MSISCIIIEDALFLREVYKFSLAKSQIQIVAEAEDGLTAIQLIKLHQPELIILDLVLPLKNGLEILKELSEISPNSKCLVITSLESEVTKSQALALGAMAYLTKPFTKKQLLDQINLITTSYNEVQNG